jgi:EAL domain-containing protein (putative c-di-GMP-specific phosphodiesterase class I)
MERAAHEAALSDLLTADPQSRGSSLGVILPKALRAVRTHLGMDVAFVSEFTMGRRIYRYVDASHRDHGIEVGGADLLEDSLCQRVIDGRLPQLIRDAAAIPGVAELLARVAMPVGAQLSVPVRLPDGSIYGTFCCLSYKADDSLTERDLGMMRVFADLAADHIDRERQAASSRRDIVERVRTVLEGHLLMSLYQPIYQVDLGRVVGYESLTRVLATPVRGPDVWFAEAAQVGLGLQLELVAIRQALLGLPRLPEGGYLSFNVSPATVLEGSLEGVFNDLPQDKIVLEITEHVSIAGYTEFKRSLDVLRARGVRIAVDDAGAGYASFRHILNIQPDIIKLDMSLTRNVDSDSGRRALASALIRFAQETGCEIIAEGVETAAELDTLRALGVTRAQGYYLGRPAPLPAPAR